MTLATDALTYERIRDARETLTAAAMQAHKHDFAGAVGAVDPFGTFVEAKRNLTALVDHLYGRDEWERMFGEDE